MCRCSPLSRANAWYESFLHDRALDRVFLVTLHTDWSPLPAFVVSLIGWMVLVEGLAYLMLPDTLVEKILYTFNTPGWYICGGLLAMVPSAYLAGYGFL